MRGHVRRRGEGWEIRAYAGVDPANGKRRYVTRTVHGTRRVADRALVELVSDVDAGRLPRTASTVGELLRVWFAAASPGFASRTVAETRSVLDRHLLPDLGSVPLRGLTALAIEEYYAGMADHGGQGREALAAGTVQRIHGILRLGLQQGVRAGWIPSNPAAEARRPRPAPPRITRPSTTDLGRLLDAAETDDPVLALWLRLAAVTGARRGELCALRWNDLRPAADGRSVLVIGRSVTFGADGLVEKATKNHQVRRLALDVNTTARLHAHRDARRALASSRGGVLGDDAFVFSNDPHGATPWFPDSVSRSFRRITTRAGLSGFRVHDLRHYVATELIAAGVDVRTVAGRLGHRNPATTLNVYAQFQLAIDQDAAELLAARIGSAAATSTAP